MRRRILVTILVPTSRDTLGHPLDPVGGLLTAGGLTGLVYGLIQGPEYGWHGTLGFGVARKCGRNFHSISRQQYSGGFAVV